MKIFSNYPGGIDHENRLLVPIFEPETFLFEAGRSVPRLLNIGFSEASV
jgi:hypothetical protein